MSKVIKGRELFKMIAEGEIDENTKVTVDNYGDCTLGFIFEDGRNLFKWLDEDFELIEDEIDAIEEYKTEYTERCIDKEVREKLNEVIRAVKQNHKEIKELKEK